MEFTDQSFWTNFWGNIKLPQKVDYGFKNDRVIANTIKSVIPKADFKKKMIEIGCAPGKWLVMFYEEMNYLVDGYEYVEIAADKTVENLKICGIKEDHFKITTGDFLKNDIKEKYDVVLSLGFIEHFDNYEDILDLHLKILKQNGHMVIGIPNFNGLNNFLQKNIDQDLTQEEKLLPKHNLKVMNLSSFKSYAKKRNLDIVLLDYIGGFEPALFNTTAIKNTIKRIGFKIVVKTLSILFYKTNTKIASSYIFAVLKPKG